MTTRTYWPLIERTRLDRRTIAVVGYTDTRVMPPELEPASDGNEIVLGAPVQMLGGRSC